MDSQSRQRDRLSRVVPAQCERLARVRPPPRSLRSNSAADIKIRRRPEGEVSILRPDELRNLLSRCAPEIVPYFAICALAALRPSEATSLQWSDIHLDTMQIEVRARHSKTHRYRLVPIQTKPRRMVHPISQRRWRDLLFASQVREAYKAAGMNEWEREPYSDGR